jgi:hypothetical protein
LDARTLRITNSIEAHCLSTIAEGATGICQYGEGFAVNLQSGGPTLIAKVNRNLEVTGLIQTKLVRRPHSIISKNEHLYTVSSGNDSIIKIDGTSGTDPRHPSASDGESIIWTYEYLQRRVHVNSLFCSANNDFYITAFGTVDMPFNQTTEKEGFIMNIHTRDRLVTHLSRPHSGIFCGDTLLYCESGRGLVKDIRGATLDLSPGYVRGLATSPERLYIGLSVHRDLSISRSTLLLDRSQNTRSGAELRVFSWKDYDLKTAEEVARVDLKHIAREIFDVLLF